MGAEVIWPHRRTLSDGGWGAGGGRGRGGRRCIGGSRLGAGGDGQNPWGFELVIVGEPVVKEPYAVAVRHDSQRLLRAINEALAEMEADGTLEALIAEWLF